MKFGVRLRKLRLLRGYNQEELGELLGYNTKRTKSSTISQYETNKKKPRAVEMYNCISDVLNVNPSMIKDIIWDDPNQVIYGFFWLSIVYGLDICDNNGELLLYFRDNKEVSSINHELNEDLHNWLEMSKKEKSGEISSDELLEWMLHYSKTHNK